jgi:hypothetical protein
LWHARLTGGRAIHRLRRLDVLRRFAAAIRPQPHETDHQLAVRLTPPVGATLFFPVEPAHGRASALFANQ